MALTRFFQDPFFGMSDPFTTSYWPFGDESQYGRSEGGMMPFRGGERGRGAGAEGGLMSWRPRCDVIEDPDSFKIRAELPGLKKENVKMDVTGDTLTIRGEINEEEEKEGRNWHRRERRMGTYLRAFTLPEGVDHDSIDAQFANGLLEVKIPKPAPGAGAETQKSINIK